MSHNYLYKMLDFLTGGYIRSDMQNVASEKPPETNIGKLFGIGSWAFEIIHENAEKVKLWNDIDNAKGYTLDRYGHNFGVKREGATDTFYRLMIKIKMISLLSGGDIDTVINAAASLFDVEPTRIELHEVFPAKVWIYVDEGMLDEERLEIAPLIAKLMKRIVAAGVGMKLFIGPYKEYSNKIYIGAVCFVDTTINAKAVHIEGGR